MFTLKSWIRYCIRPNYRTYPYKPKVDKSIILRLQPVYFFVYFFVKAYVVGTHLNWIDLSLQFNEYPPHMLL